jgi:hypothetical protein
MTRVAAAPLTFQGLSLLHVRTAASSWEELPGPHQCWGVLHRMTQRSTDSTCHLQCRRCGEKQGPVRRLLESSSDGVLFTTGHSTVICPPAVPDVGGGNVHRRAPGGHDVAEVIRHLEAHLCMRTSWTTLSELKISVRTPGVVSHYSADLHATPHITFCSQPAQPGGTCNAGRLGRGTQQESSPKSLTGKSSMAFW